jgi:inward rectifier potassium channel
MFANPEARRRQLLVLGGNPPGLKDVYHYLLRTSWTVVIGWAVLLFMTLNLMFGTGYFLLGGVTNAHDFTDCFFFSVQTLATIGYGTMYPQSVPAELLMTVEALAGLLMSAMMTGLAFAKFSRPRARVLWSKICVVSDRDGVPTMMFRVANERMNHIVEANIRVAVLRSEVTQEGERLRKVVDLPLQRSSTPSFILSWTVMHPIVPGSPLYGMTGETMVANQSEIVLTLTGLDETLGQTIHSRASYIPSEIHWAARFDDILGKVTDDGRRIIDYTKFHESKPAKLNWEKLGVEIPVGPARA